MRVNHGPGSFANGEKNRRYRLTTTRYRIVREAVAVSKVPDETPETSVRAMAKTEAVLRESQ
jgi:hypothetical protein